MVEGKYNFIFSWHFYKTNRGNYSGNRKNVLSLEKWQRLLLKSNRKLEFLQQEVLCHLNKTISNSKKDNDLFCPGQIRWFYHLFQTSKAYTLKCKLSSFKLNVFSTTSPLWKEYNLNVTYLEYFPFNIFY